MADKARDKLEKSISLQGESVSDYAKREMADADERERKKQKYWENQKRVTVELPQRFFALVRSLRKEVDTFNQIVDPPRRVSFSESVGLAAGAEVGKAEMNVSFGRRGVEAWVGLSELMRLGRAPAAYIIEAHVKLSRSRLRVRAEAIPRGDDDVRYRVTVDGRETKFGIDDLASRLVLAIVKDDPVMLDGTPDPV